ncbi:hypothetical protein F4703DRAFT_1847135 [Phycomyces blakesleeanus]
MTLQRPNSKKKRRHLSYYLQIYLLCQSAALFPILPSSPFMSLYISLSLPCISTYLRLDKPHLSTCTYSFSLSLSIFLPLSFYIYILYKKQLFSK